MRIVKRWVPFIVFFLPAGMIVLAGYLAPIPGLVYFRDVLVEWAVIVAAFAFLLGVFNILRVHGGQIRRRQPGWFYSVVLVLAMLIALIPPVLQSLPMLGVPVNAGTQKMLDGATRATFNDVISPVGAALAALVVFALVLAAFRMMRTRRSGWTILFLLTAAIALLGSTPLIGLEWLAELRDWMVNVLGMAGMRGLLLGVALGVIITALRAFIGSERPYSEF